MDWWSAFEVTKIQSKNIKTFRYFRFDVYFQVSTKCARCAQNARARCALIYKFAFKNNLKKEKSK